MTKENEEILVVKEESEKIPTEQAKESDEFCKTFIDDSDNEPLLTQDSEYLGEELSEHRLIDLNESLEGSEIQKKSNAYYVRRVDNHLEIGFARIEFFR